MASTHSALNAEPEPEPMLRSPTPQRKRKRAGYLEEKTLDGSKDLSNGPTVAANTFESTCSSSTSSETNKMEIPDEDDPNVSMRLTALRALGVCSSRFDMRRVMEIPEEFFWGDQHPRECSCFWCDEFFGPWAERSLEHLLGTS